MSSGAADIEWMYANMQPTAFAGYLKMLIIGRTARLLRPCGDWQREMIEDSLYDLSLELLKHEVCDE